MQIVCTACRGQKKVRGIGCLIAICKACNGKGYVEHIHDINTPTIQSETKKRTRRMKANEEKEQA